MPREGPDEVRVEVNSGRKARTGRQGQSTFVYVNEGFTGSVNSVAENRTPAPVQVPISGVYREQYCVCSRWPYTQRILAIAVGVLLGTLIGLGISILVKDKGDNVIGPIFRRAVPD